MPWKHSLCLYICTVLFFYFNSRTLHFLVIHLSPFYVCSLLLSLVCVCVFITGILLSTGPMALVALNEFGVHKMFEVCPFFCVLRPLSFTLRARDAKDTPGLHYLLVERACHTSATRLVVVEVNERFFECAILYSSSIASSPRSLSSPPCV